MIGGKRVSVAMAPDDVNAAGVKDKVWLVEQKSGEILYTSMGCFIVGKERFAQC